MRKAIVLLTVVFLCLIVSCDSNSITTNTNYSSNTNQPSISQAEAIAKFGDVSRIYSASSSKSIIRVPAETDQPRFFTGQKISNFRGYKLVEFEANLVEYNSIDPVILEYVEALESNNALMHQNYPGFTSESIIPEKKYVEFATYTDVETGNTLFHEVRVFYGDFMDQYHKNFWYAKSVLFSSDLTIDVNLGVNVFTGENASYKPVGAASVSSSSLKQLKEMRETDHRTDLMARLGDVNRVFAWYSDGEFDYIHMFGGDDILAECYLVELNSLSDEATSAIDAAYVSNALHQREWTIVSLEGKYYVEVVYYNDQRKPEDSWTELRLRTKKMDNFKYGYYTKCFNLH